MTFRCGEEQSHCSGTISSLHWQQNLLQRQQNLLQLRTPIVRAFQPEPTYSSENYTRYNECFLSQTTKHVFQSIHHCSPSLPTHCSEIHSRCSKCSRFLNISIMNHNHSLLKSTHHMLCFAVNIKLHLFSKVSFFCL